jgi:hypothetical protein
LKHIDKRQLQRLADLTDINTAKAEIAALAPEQRSSFIDDNGGRWSDLKFALWTLGNMKCWYSEAVLQQQEGHVEHYRPKKKPHGLNGVAHSGYWWRAFDWTNFRLSHPTSNVRITDYLTGKKVGKGAYFPLRDGDVRAIDEASERYEHPVLLDPTVIGDCKLICFDTNDGKPLATYSVQQDPWKNERAVQSIAFYHLDEGTWNYQRKDLMDEVGILCDRLIEAESSPDKDQALCDQLSDELVSYINEHKPFTAACTQVIKEKGLIEAVS